MAGQHQGGWPGTLSTRGVYTRGTARRSHPSQQDGTLGTQAGVPAWVPGAWPAARYSTYQI